MIKPRAPELLRQAFERRSWHGEPILFSGNTDCYQPLEATYGLTRACLKVCAEYRNPVTIITKAALITRDLDVLLQLQAHAWIQVYFSIPFADNDVARAVEPQAPTITKRLEAMRILSEAGIHTGVSLAPIIPGLNEEAMADILSMARQAGAQDAMYALLRLTGSVETVFLERMAAAFPDRLTKITNRLREVRGGTLSDSGFFTRHQGQGTYWKMIEQLFQITRKKAGFPETKDQVIPQTFRRPDDGQTNLFDLTEI
jgi:DNA repair photolyase